MMAVLISKDLSHAWLLLLFRGKIPHCIVHVIKDGKKPAIQCWEF